MTGHIKDSNGNIVIECYDIIPVTRWMASLSLNVMRQSESELHDHPTWNLCVVLRGAFIEHTFQVKKDGTWGFVKRYRTPGSVFFVPEDRPHKVEIIRYEGTRSPMCLSLSGVNHRVLKFYETPNHAIAYSDYPGPTVTHEG